MAAGRRAKRPQSWHRPPVWVSRWGRLNLHHHYFIFVIIFNINIITTAILRILLTRGGSKVASSWSMDPSQSTMAAVTKLLCQIFFRHRLWQTTDCLSTLIYTIPSTTSIVFGPYKKQAHSYLQCVSTPSMVSINQEALLFFLPTYKWSWWQQQWEEIILG